MIDVVRLLSDLVAIDSVSARPNRPIVDRLASELGRMGFMVQLLPYADDAGVEKHNLVAQAGPSGAGGLAFVGHTDTVPYDPEWKDALRLTPKDGNLYARGSADTKGFIAAVLAAIDGFDLRRLKAPLLCVFTADEEVGCVGAKKLVELGAARPAHAIVGEPTQLVPVRAHKGYCLAEIEVLGQEGHSAYPHLGRSAILDAGRLLTRVTALARELEAEADPLFTPPFTTVNVGTIAGGKARNVIPGRCVFPLEWRPIPGQRVDRVPELLAAAIEGLRAEHPGFEAHFQVTRRDGGVSVAPDAPVVRFLEAETGHEAITIPFGTELPQLTELGAQGCVCGPGDIRVAHRTGEFVPEADLAAATRLYRRAVEAFLT